MNGQSTPDFKKDDKGVPWYDRGRKWPAWFIIAVPFILLAAFLVRRVKNISWKAVFATVLFFETVTIFLEHHSILMGHWVYNRSRIFGVLVWDVPIEELLIYYLFPPVFVIAGMLIIYQKFSKQK